MDLDVLKKEWKNNVAFQKEIEESMIKRMLANSNKGAFERIKQNEKQALRIIPIMAIAFICMNFSILLKGSPMGIFVVLLMIPICAGLWYWSYWLCGFLNKIDMSRMPVTEISRLILKYRTYLIRHTVIASILMPLYLGIWSYYYSSANNLWDELSLSTGDLIVYLLSVLTLFFVIIWFRFFRHVGTIRKNLRELEEFEKED